MNRSIRQIQLGGCSLLLGLAAAARATEASPAALSWPEVPPEQLREDVFGVKLRAAREFSGDAAGKKFLVEEMKRNPQPAAKAYYAWFCLYGAGWGAPELVNPPEGRRLAEEAIQQGSIVARDALGRAIAQGVGKMADPALALRLLREAAAAGATRSMARLAYFQAIGWQMPQNLVEAEQLAQRAAELGQPLGLYEIGLAFEDGTIGGRPDPEKAVRFFFAAARHADSDAWRKLLELDKKGVAGAARYRLVSRLREVSDGVWIAPAVVRKEVAELAGLAGDDPEALVELARMHVTGEYAKRDYAKARSMFTQAGAAGNPSARFFLAQMRLRGQGGPKEVTPALTEIRELAAQGDPQAANYLGWLHYWGASEAPGIEKNERLAFEHCRQAAERGLVNALLNLGFCYENGIGTPKSYELAVKVYWQAYLRGVPNAGERVRRILPHIKI